jgi:transcriptional regulator
MNKSNLKQVLLKTESIISDFVNNERYIFIKLLREKGVKDAEIARRLNLSRERIDQICEQEEGGDKHDTAKN